MAEVNKISSFKSFSEIKSQQNDMKLKEENNLKKQETLSKIEEILDEMGLTNLSEIDEDSQKAFISKLLGEEQTKEQIKESVNLTEATMQEIDKKVQKFVIKNANDYDYSNQDSAFQIYLSLKKLYPNLIKESEEAIEEGNAFGDAVRKAKEAGETEFEFDGKTFKVEEAVVNEGSHGMATKLLQSLVKGETSKAEGIKMSKELAQHYIDWIKTSPYGKKNGNLPLNMLIDASFNWGIERGLDPSLKSELKDLKGMSVKESFLLTEGTRGQFGKIDKQGKIQSVYTHYDSYPENMLPIIKKHYKNAKAVNNVIANGDMSGLDAFDNINFYGATSKPSIGSADKINDFVKFTKENGGAEFVYLFDERDKKWYMIDIYGGSKLVPAYESLDVNEGAVKQFETDFSDMVKNIQRGYGWIDPEFVADTWENSSDTIDFELVKGEIYNRLIKADLLWYSDEDGEEKGKQVKSLKELGIKESLVNEGKDDFMARHSGTDIWLKKGYKNHTEAELQELYFKIGELVKDNLDVKTVTVLFESKVNEAEIKSDDEFKEYAFSVLKKAFGSDFDEAKGQDIVDGILGKVDGDYGAAVGMLTSSLG